MARNLFNESNGQKQSTVGLLVIFGEIISNQQRDEVFVYLKKAFQFIDKDKFEQIAQIFNDLIRSEDFQPDSQYRQIANNENGSLAGFLYQPNFHTVLNVLKDYLNSCSHVSMIFCGQQIDTSGGWILSDSIFVSEHIHNLFEENSTFIIEQLQILLPFISHQWTRLLKQKFLKTIEIDDLSKENNANSDFGEIFTQKLMQILNSQSVSFDIYNKLIPRDNSGTIAFDEPNLYILYGQQGEASLFGIRGFVVLINGGFSRIPSYWNLIRGLQTIDACILTHFDYDVLPGLQSLLHRKTMALGSNGRSCKPDIGAFFLNQTQRTRIQSSPGFKSTSNSKLLLNLSHNIDQVYNDIKQLNIDTFDLVKTTALNKPSIEPINLFKKIAFGSLDLFVLYPTASITDDEKVLGTIQKIPIRDQQPSPLNIPLHHWYSSCTLLVWTPTSKMSKENLVRILYTGACPQTLVFEALGRVRHLEFLHESQVINRPNTANVKQSAAKTKPTSSASNGEITKLVTRTANPKTKPTTTIKPEKPRSAPVTTGKKTSATTTGENSQSTDRNRTTENSPKNSTSVNRIDNHLNSSTNTDPDSQVKRPDSVSFTNDTGESFVESTTASPSDEMHAYLVPTNPMTTSFVDGAPNTQNPFFDKTDGIEIIHHNISTSTHNPMPSIDEIIPQNLPMDDDTNSKKTSATTKKSIASPSSTSTARKSKQSTPSGMIFYVDVAYIPYHGNEHYVDSEFFRRIRARYYVLNAVEINRLTLESLLEGKQQWEKQEHTPVTLVPTFDGDRLRQFFVQNKTRLAELNINILPASTRCNVQYDDEGSPAQRLRFSNEQSN